MGRREDGRRGQDCPLRRIQGSGAGDEPASRRYAGIPLQLSHDTPLHSNMLTSRAGMDKMQKSMTVYVKSLSKRAEGDDKEKSLPGGNLGSSMVTHGEDFEPDSEYGTCLSCGCFPMPPLTSTVLTAPSTRPSKRAPCPRPGNICRGSHRDLARGPGALSGTNEGIPGMPSSHFPPLTTGTNEHPGSTQEA